MKFIVIEGLDGSGKSTQVNLLRNYLSVEKIKYRYLHFPRTETPIFGELIARFLRGEMGDIHAVDPYLIALIYAGDRFEASEMIRKWLEEDHFVLVDRYVISNIAFQCAKLDKDTDRLTLGEWINRLEYEYYKIPQPDLNIFLDVPFEFTETQLSAGRSGEDRSYLRGNADIHENNLEFQKRVREIYLKMGVAQKNFRLVNCASDTGKVLAPDLIFNKIVKIIFNP
jgi:dTMP kinase